jgi:hypothetical protein
MKSPNEAQSSTSAFVLRMKESEFQLPILVFNRIALKIALFFWEEVL